MRLWAALMMALVLLAPQGARAQTQQDAEAMARWSSEFQSIIANVTQPLANMPQVYIGMSGRERRAWVTQSRAWAAQFGGTLQAVRAAAARLPPPPPNTTYTEIFTQQASELPTMFSALEAFLSEYNSSIDAVERNEPQALRRAVASLLDSQLILARQYRDADYRTADAVQGAHPQRFLLRSLGHSYRGFIATLTWQRARTLEQPPQTEAMIAELRIVVGDMRREIRDGRMAAGTLLALLEGGQAPASLDAGYVERWIAAVRSYDASFDREEAIAREYEAITQAFASGKAEDAFVAEYDAHMDRIAALDLERVGDMQQRTRMMQ